MRILYQFPISHYCEKARWALEFKGLDYEIKNLLPGPHLATTTKIAPKSHTPILVDGDDVIQGSPEIIDYLDKRHKQRPLTPTTTQEASTAHEWERYADHNFGVTLRLFFYYHVLQDRKLATGLLTADGPWWGPSAYLFMFPVVRKRMREAMKITAENADAARTKILHAYDQTERKLVDQRFLAGPAFSRADLAVTALLAPMWRDGPALPTPLAAFITELEHRPLTKWARAIYAEYR